MQIEIQLLKKNFFSQEKAIVTFGLLKANNNFCSAAPSSGQATSIKSSKQPPKVTILV